MFGGHTNGLDGELAAAEIEEVFQVRTQEVDDENVMETLLSKVVDLRYTNCVVSRGRGMRENFDGCKNNGITYECRSRFGTIDTHPAVEELPTSEVPVDQWKLVCSSSKVITRRQSGMEEH